MSAAHTQDKSAGAPNSEASGLTDDELLRIAEHGELGLIGSLIVDERAKVADWHRFVVKLSREAIAAHEAKRPPSTSAEAVASGYEQVEASIVARYRVEPMTHGFWGHCVRCGTSSREVFVGHKSQCEKVAAALTTACLDGAFMASKAHPAPATAAAGEAWPTAELIESGVRVVLGVDKPGQKARIAALEAALRKFAGHTFDPAPPTDPKADPDLLRKMAEVLGRAHEALHLVGCSPEGAASDLAQAAGVQADIDQLLKEARQ